MSGLFSSLTLAGRGMDAQRIALELTGQNISNVNTAGYARRTVDFASVPGATAFDSGGVRVESIRAIRDRLLERRVRDEVPTEGKQAALAEMLQVVQAGLGPSGASVDSRMTALFGAFSRLAEDPTSGVTRADVLNSAGDLVQVFHDASSKLVDAQRSADQRVRGAVEQINSIANQLAALNDSLGSSGPQGKMPVQDREADLIRQLSELVHVDVIERPEGGMDVTIGNGRALVIANTAYAVTAVAGPPNGLSSIQHEGRNITGEITSGRLGGALAARDVNIPDYISRLDTIAYEVARQVNTVHQAGFDPQGNTNQTFFTPLAGVAGAARLIAVDPAVAANGGLIAAAGVAAVGDNGAAKQLANLRDALVLDGNTSTLLEGWSNFTYRVGRDTRAAIDGQSSQAEIIKQVDSLRDQVEGVSLDEEAMQMLKFQRAFEANARFFNVVDRTLSTLFSLVGVG